MSAPIKRKRPGVATVEVAPEKDKLKDQAVYKIMYNLRVAHTAINNSIDSIEKKIIENWASKDCNIDIHLCLENVLLTMLECHQRKKCVATYLICGEAKRQTYNHPFNTTDWKVSVVRKNTSIRLELSEEGKKNVKNHLERGANKQLVSDIVWFCI
jgi:hypothetical protein